MGLPVRFAASDSQRQGRGRVSSDMPVGITQQPDRARRSPEEAPSTDSLAHSKRMPNNRKARAEARAFVDPLNCAC